MSILNKLLLDNDFLKENPYYIFNTNKYNINLNIKDSPKDLCQTCVSNVKVKSIRPKYEDIVDWMSDPNNVYIGRAGIVFVNKVRQPKQSSIWANPYKTKKYSLSECLKLYKIYIIKKIKDENLMDELLELRGKNLGCWCINTKSSSDPVCHGQILMQLIDQYE